jgi:hypothetical protein
MASPPYIVFLAVSGTPLGTGALYQTTGASGQQQAAVSVQYEATDNTDTLVLAASSLVVPLYFADATGDSARKIKDRVEDAVLAAVTANPGPSEPLPGATADNVSFVWTS